MAGHTQSLPTEPLTVHGDGQSTRSSTGTRSNLLVRAGANGVWPTEW